jgi:hypothetical protein
MVTPPCFPPLEPHHLPRGHPRRLDDDDELCCISRRFSYRYYAKQKCEYCDKVRIDRNCRQTPTVFLATDFHIVHDPNMHDVLVYYFGTSGSAAHAYGTFKLVNILSFTNFLTSLSSVRSGISNLCCYSAAIIMQIVQICFKQKKMLTFEFFKIKTIIGASEKNHFFLQFTKL